jgi:hypothetical protein
MFSTENKLSHNDIVIVGDSFCASRTTSNTWPTKLVELLTGDSTPARGKGFSGCHWWSTKRCLDQELAISLPKILVVCHTETSRVPSDLNYPLNYSTVQSGDEKYLPHRVGPDWRLYQEAAKKYYKYLQSDAWDEWTSNAWYKELDELITEHNIPCVIHLFCFTQSNPYNFKNGLTSKERLAELATLHPGKSNHLSEQANISIATAIADMITNHYQDGVIKDFNLLRLCK